MLEKGKKCRRVDIVFVLQRLKYADRHVGSVIVLQRLKYAECSFRYFVHVLSWGHISPADPRAPRQTVHRPAPSSPPHHRDYHHIHDHLRYHHSRHPHHPRRRQHRCRRHRHHCHVHRHGVSSLRMRSAQASLGRFRIDLSLFSSNGENPERIQQLAHDVHRCAFDDKCCRRNLPFRVGSEASPERKRHGQLVSQSLQPADPEVVKHGRRSGNIARMNRQERRLEKQVKENLPARLEVVVRVAASRAGGRFLTKRQLDKVEDWMENVEAGMAAYEKASTDEENDILSDHLQDIAAKSRRHSS